MAASMELSKSEQRVLDVLWSESPLTVGQVIERLKKGSGWHENTIKTLLTRLVQKKAVARRKDGGRFFYRPLVSRDAAGKLLVQSSDGGLGTTWTGADESFSDDAWTEVITGIGYKAPGTPPGGTTPAVFDPTTGHYMQLVSAQNSWTTARNNAQTMSLGGVVGHLATLKSAAENAFATARLAGASASAPPGVSFTVSNAATLSAPSGIGQPASMRTGTCGKGAGA